MYEENRKKEEEEKKKQQELKEMAEVPENIKEAVA